MSCSICPGFNVLWWHHAVDTPSTVWFHDWRVVINSVRYLLTPSHAAHPEIFTHGSLLSILPISSAINAPIIPMPMKQPWRIWVFKPHKSSRTHKSNQTKHNKLCAHFTGNTASQGYNSDGTNYCSLGILRKELTAFFFFKLYWR